MNNGDKIRKMTNEELAETICKDSIKWRDMELDRFYVHLLNYLNTEVEKTADEMFEELGFEQTEDDAHNDWMDDKVQRLFYEDRNNNLVIIPDCQGDSYRGNFSSQVLQKLFLAVAEKRKEMEWED